jgi:release factor glutamine methyltransferase
VSWWQLYKEVEDLLDGVEARWLVEEASGLDRSQWDTGTTARGAGRLSLMVDRRLSGEPLQYVVGHWSFRGLDLMVDHRALIPRPETEMVAEVALEEAVRAGARRGAPDPWAALPPSFGVADLGTGSGALALALVAELPEAEVWATDVSPSALAVARANLAAVGLAATRVRLVQGMWYEALPEERRGRLRVIVSNPPYVAEAEWATLDREVRDHEPRSALVAGPTGRECLEALVDGGLEWLEPGGALVLELAPHQAGIVAARARDAGYQEVDVRPDLAGRPRVLAARKSSEFPPPEIAGGAGLSPEVQ